jgi:hypothetical protein
MTLRPITLKHACAFVAEHHRHHRPPQGAKFALAAWHANLGEATERLVGVAIIGRPVSRVLDDGLTAEVTRVATDGTRNVNSFLYGAAKRAAQAMGYRRVITYTLPEESGASLRAVGWVGFAGVGGGTWHRSQRPRTTTSPIQQKIRWDTYVD